jgi:hypothetical protein
MCVGLVGYCPLLVTLTSGWIIDKSMRFCTMMILEKDLRGPLTEFNFVSQSF